MDTLKKKLDTLLEERARQIKRKTDRNPRDAAF